MTLKAHPGTRPGQVRDNKADALEDVKAALFCCLLLLIQSQMDGDGGRKVENNIIHNTTRGMIKEAMN